MKLKTTPLLATTVLGLALSAGSAQAQVTLVSQNRSVSASAYYNPPTCSQSTTVPASGFSAFTQNLTVQCPGANSGNGSQTSTLSPTGFNVQMSASVSGNAPLSGSSGSSSFEVVFDVAGNVPYTNTGTGGTFRLVGPGIDRFLAASENGTLQPGRYTLTCGLNAFGPGGSSGGSAQSTMAFGQALPDFTINWSTIDCGGGDATGGVWTLSSTMGQHDAGTLTPVFVGPSFSLLGGYWAVRSSTCYANCDGNTTAPLLSAADFVCFLGRFKAGDVYANCDNNTAPPTLTAADFVCFLDRFRAGCP